jgi:hypothetical protein
MSVESNRSVNDATPQPKKRGRRESFSENEAVYVHPGSPNTISTDDKASRNRKRARAGEHSDSALTLLSANSSLRSVGPKQGSLSPDEQAIVNGQQLSEEAELVQWPVCQQPLCRQPLCRQPFCRPPSLAERYGKIMMGTSLEEIRRLEAYICGVLWLTAYNSYGMYAIPKFSAPVEELLLELELLKEQELLEELVEEICHGPLRRLSNPWSLEQEGIEHKCPIFYEAMLNLLRAARGKPSGSEQTLD